MRRDAIEPEDGSDTWCVWCGSDLLAADEVWLVKGYDRSRWPAAFCSEGCASDWGNAATQGNEYKADRSVLAGVRLEGEA